MPTTKAMHAIRRERMEKPLSQVIQLCMCVSPTVQRP